MSYPKENIPNKDSLFRTINKLHYDHESDTLNIGMVFRNLHGGMSTDWSKYSSPTASRNRRKTPKDNGVIELNVGNVRSIEAQTVEHEPSADNQSHSEVLGEKTLESQIKFSEIFTWRVKPNQ